MKVIAVFFALLGISGLTTIQYAEGASKIVALAVALAFLWGAYKLWTRKKKVKEPVAPVIQEPANQSADMNQPLEPIEYDDLILRSGEQVYFVIPAQTFVTKTRVTKYESEYSGGSVRIAKGVSIRKGKRDTAPIRESVNDIIGKGDYIVTNKRVAFVGLGDSFEIPLEKITSVTMLARNGFAVIAGNQSHNLTIEPPGSERARTATMEMVKRFVEQ